MKYLLFGGARNTGKSGAIYRFVGSLLKDEEYKVISTEKYPSEFKDCFKLVIEGYGMKILIHAHTDDVACCKEFSKYLAAHNDVNIVIAAVRDYSDPFRARVLGILSDFCPDIKPEIVEIPLGKCRNVHNLNLRESIRIEWYYKNIDKLSIMLFELLVLK